MKVHPKIIKLSSFGPFVCSLLFILISQTHASDSLSYSGRLVKADGSPVTDAVDLKVELAYTDNTITPLCSQSFTDVNLTNGVFHLKLDLICTSDPFNVVLENIPPNESIAIRITDETNLKTYSYQALHSMPLAQLAHTSKKLVQMGATDGQILTWDNGEWKPLAPAATASGSIGTTELADGSVTNPKVATGIGRGKLAAGTANYVLINDGSGFVSEAAQIGILQGGTGSSTAAGARTNLGIVIGTAAGQFMGADAVPACAANEKLYMTPGPTFLWDCIADGDATKLPLAGGIMTGAIDMGTNRIIDVGTPTLPGDATNKAYVDSEIADVNASQWTTAGSNIHFDTGNVGIGTGTPSQKLDIVGNIAISGKAMLKSDNANYVELKAPAALASTLSFNLPGTYGNFGQALTTNGAGLLSWSEVATTASAVGGDLSGTISNAQLVAGTIVDADISATAAIAQTKIANLTTDLAAKEPSISAGVTTQYWRGDKSWQILNTTAVPEDTNLYFTEPRVRGTALTGYAVGTAAPLAGTDTFIQGLGKLEAQIIANDAAFDNTGQWSKNVSDIYFNTGKVGIGVSSPSSLLQVSASDTDTQVIIENISSATDKYPGVKILNYSGTGWGHPILSFGNIGGSSGAPAATGSDRILASIIGSGFDGTSFPQAARIEFVTEDIFSGTTSPANIQFSTTSHGQTSFSEKMRITADGNVGIGTSSPVEKLEVSGTGSPKIALLDADNLGADDLYASYVVGRDSANADVWYMGDGSSGKLIGLMASQPGYKMFLGTNGAERLTITDSGLVGVGTTSPTAALDVAGKIRGIASVSYDSSSATLTTTSLSSVFVPDISTSISVQNGDIVKVDLACNLSVTTGGTVYMRSHVASGPSYSWLQVPNWITVSSSTWSGGFSTGIYKAAADGTVTFQSYWHVTSGNTGYAVYCNINAFVLGK